MDGVELRSRREALGISQEELARIFDVKQASVSRWESGTRPFPEPLAKALQRLENIQDDIIDELCAQGEDTIALDQLAPVEFRVYTTNQEYWASDERAKDEQIPAAVHRTAAARAIRILKEESQIDASIIKG